MAAHGTSTHSSDPTVPARPPRTTLALLRRSRTDPAAREAAAHPRQHPPESLDGIRAAASVMGWVLWLLLALTMAAFLTFAPSML